MEKRKEGAQYELGKLSSLGEEVRQFARKSGRRHEEPHEDLNIQQTAQSLFGLSNEELQVLRQRVRDSNGMIIALVHPYMEKYYGGTPKEHVKDQENLANVVERMEYLVSESGAIKFPIFVFEFSEDVLKTKEHAQKLKPEGNVYFIPTQFANPDPTFSVETSGGTLAGAWPEARAVLMYIGVQKVLLGGMYYADTGGFTTCVDVVKDALEPYFPVKVSKSLTFSPGYE